MPNLTESFTSNSGNIASIAYEQREDATEMVVSFRSGPSYRYFEVPKEIFDALKAAETTGASVGSLFHKLVRSGGFEYEQV